MQLLTSMALRHHARELKEVCNKNLYREDITAAAYSMKQKLRESLGLPWATASSRCLQRSFLHLGSWVLPFCLTAGPEMEGQTCCREKNSGFTSVSEAWGRLWDVRAGRARRSQNMAEGRRSFSRALSCLPQSGTRDLIKPGRRMWCLLSHQGRRMLWRRRSDKPPSRLTLPSSLRGWVSSIVVIAGIGCVFIASGGEGSAALCRGTLLPLSPVLSA
jgi:hypothetical protein